MLNGLRPRIPSLRFTSSTSKIGENFSKPPTPTPSPEPFIPSPSQIVSELNSEVPEPVVEEQSTNEEQKLYSELEEMLHTQGFTPIQSHRLVLLISEAVHESMSTSTKQMVPNTEQKTVAAKQTAQLDSIRKDIMGLETRDFVALSSELERVVEG